MSGQKILIIGGVAAGPKAAARARRVAPDAEITIVERGSFVSYAGCGMPYYLSGEVPKFEHLFETTYSVIRDPDFFWGEKGVKMLTRTEAKSIDREKKEVLVENLETGEQYTLPYDKLVLATGASPVTPPLEGLDLKGVHRLNHPDDVQAIKKSFEEKDVQEVVIVGSGLIGLEIADAVAKLHCFSTVVELQDQILPGLLDPEVAAWLSRKMEEAGVEFRVGQKVMRMKGDEDGNVTGVVTDQEEIDGDLVFISIGVRPNVELAKNAGLDIGKTGAIAVNDHLQTNDPDIYALGDCVENTNLITGQKVFVPLASTANRQGRVVGDNITGGDSTFKGILGTGVMHSAGYNVARTGLSEKQARELGYSVVTSLINGFDRTHYHPDHGMMLTKMIADEKTGRILGAQAAGDGEVVKRIDVLATAITFGATVEQVADMDLSYAPPFNTPIDPVQNASNMVRNKMAGLARSISAAELKGKMDAGEDFVILDCRTEDNFKMRHLKDDRVILIVLSELRANLDKIPTGKEVVIVCALGTRAYQALCTLKGAGFEEVSYLEAGLQGWPYDL